jgi:DnaK suppressor protein
MTTDTDRTSLLTQMLTERRREIGSVVDSRIRDGRQRQPKEVGDIGEDSATLNQDDLEIALLQMRAETVNRIDEALARLAADQYGACAVCGLEISERRLRALPFAVRCKRCEDRREENNDKFREFAKQGGGFTHDSAGA